MGRRATNRNPTEVLTNPGDIAMCRPDAGTAHVGSIAGSYRIFTGPHHPATLDASDLPGVNSGYSKRRV